MHSLNWRLQMALHEVIGVVISTTVTIVKGFYSAFEHLVGEK
jgi:hypothetical protein